MSVEHFRWPFGREYPVNPELDNPPIYITVKDPATGIETQKKIYIPQLSTSTQAQKDADELLAKILKVSLGMMMLVGLVAMGVYIGKKI